MLAKLAEDLPPGAGYLYEPKWDGFRAIVFRGRNDVYIQSRDRGPSIAIFRSFMTRCSSAFRKTAWSTARS